MQYLLIKLFLQADHDQFVSIKVAYKKLDNAKGKEQIWDFLHYYIKNKLVL